MTRRPTLLVLAFVAAPAAADTVPDIAVVTGDVVVLSPVAQGGTTAEETAVFVPPPAAQMAALAVAAGMPRPSISVGLIDPEPASFPAAEDEAEAAGTEIGFADTEAWLTLRASDSALFRSLVEAGALDPPDGDFASAIQSELKRAGCYGGKIDGVFGNGSHGALGGFFDTAGVEAFADAPGPALFRQVLLAGDVNCPAPVVARSRVPGGVSGQSANRSGAQDDAPEDTGIGDVWFGGTFN